MNWDIETPEGMHNAQLWFKGHVEQMAEGGIWAIPRNLTVYRIHSSSRVLELNHGPGDGATEKVAESLGWSITRPN